MKKFVYKKKNLLFCIEGENYQAEPLKKAVD
jgi:hypothetical protein